MKKPSPLDAEKNKLVDARADASKRAGMLDARVVILERDLAALKGEHREALGLFKGLDAAVRQLEQAAIKPSIPVPHGTPHA